MASETTMVEKVARAILARRVQSDWCKVEQGRWAIDHDLELARAAIEAMREPTEAMEYAGIRNNSSVGSTVVTIWRAMVDNAIGEDSLAVKAAP